MASRYAVTASNVMESWDQIHAWRRSKRVELLERRRGLSSAERRSIRSAVTALVLDRVTALRGGCIGSYWPIKGEIDPRPLVRACLERGARAALPVVVEKFRPLEFWAWEPSGRLRRGIWNIPVPVQRRVVRPTALLVPLLGFDSAGHRLGYGGGHYDRTLAAMPTRPLTIGIGHEFGRLETIHPQPHDIAMDAVVTEAGIRWFGQGPG